MPVTLMIQRQHIFDDINTLNKYFDGQFGSREEIIRILTENKMNFGYTASILSIMNGSAKALLILEPISKKKKAILSKNCNIASVPFFEFSTTKEDILLKDLFPSGIKVLSIVS